MRFTALTQLLPVHAPAGTLVTVGSPSEWPETVNAVALAVTFQPELVPPDTVIVNENGTVWSVPSSETLKLGAVPSVSVNAAAAPPAKARAAATAKVRAASL